MASGRVPDSRIGAAWLNLASEPPSADIHSEPHDISPQTVTKRVVSRELILKFNKKSKGGRARNQFRLV